MTSVRSLSAITAALFLVSCFGCGSASNRLRSTVFIRTLRFDPSTLTVDAGTTVRWRNSDTAAHTVTSGNLDPAPDPTFKDVAILDSQFSPKELRLRVGDTVRWTNRDLATHQIVFASGQPIEFTSPPLQENEDTTLQILHAGVFEYQDPFTPGLTGRIIAEGVPDPDGQFDSGGISPGQEFEFTFNIPGTFTYFCKFHNVEEARIVAL
ncbi:MAG: plastocyanin/azurin family copper-binding protein [Armatimonadota bacterium]|nr:plastocyanin/azurin family copper-binding protein [Armatimonadota bacterium]